ncbi:iron-containing alcohol dehydrogenase [Anoxynatronum buryatiense]|uniref:Alcohol dehydrogenase n=1 Tax=Anoxynatronum buryatiense TaxID=489973 RepID=A0AA45WU21_9CLOT|nr:iron-containing alcohol dehydrogenase [Anoxynatronum buryatiense]SMP45632.1 alcohol dehydrogenase [Anoxynatronum buryatiense]
MITTYDVFVPMLMGGGASLRTGLKVRELGCQKVLVVYDQGIKEVGIAGKIEENIRNAGVETVCFEDVVPDPPDKMIEEAAEIAKREAIDGIVAVGGGSAMDSAKGINVLMNNPPPIVSYFGIQKNLKPGVPMIFIPTTSGTGSEVTNMAVVSATDLGKKDSVVSPVCLATLAIIDPELTLELPPKLTAITGIDALAHAVESLTGGHANPMSDALAREAIRSIHHWLPIAVENGGNYQAREALMMASTHAGMAFTNALVHLGHCIGHALGASFHIPHGTACAATLPEVIEYAAKTESMKVRMICECLQKVIPEQATTDEIGRIGRDALRSFIKSVGIPNLKQMGLTLEEAMSVAPRVTKDEGMALAPYRITPGKVAEMIASAYDA